MEHNPGSPGDQDPQQLELPDLPRVLRRPEARRAAGHSHTPAYLAETDPVARVIVDSPVPHLDRPFDYGVPKDLADAAQPGTRVRVRFGGRQLQGWLIQRTDQSEVPRERLQPLIRVQSELPVLTPATLEIARAVAARCAGLVSDVLRAAVPPRVASVEKQVVKAAADTAETEDSDATDATAEKPDQDLVPVVEAPSLAESAWTLYDGGDTVLERLGQQPDTDSPGEPVRAVVQALPSHPEHTAVDLVAQAVAATRSAGRGAVVVVPDAKTLDRVQAAVEALVPSEDVARLHSDDKPTPRYRAFVQVLQGHRRVALGTRPAVWAPVKDAGLVVVMDDGDSSLTERRAPYHHARDVALVRAEQENLSLLLVGHSVTPEAQRLVDTGWALPVRADRETLRANMPRIVATADSWHRERDSLAGRARLPETAFRVAREALEDGPVLVQVARAGYAPTIACERCRTPARCTACDGPLTLPRSGGRPTCGWCSREALAWSCSVCEHRRWRMSSVGSQRTAEELGRAFPQVPVINSSGERIRRVIDDEPALVVATPGAEPWVEGRYRAALLLDGDRMLSRPGLRSEEETLRRWFDAAALVRRGADGGSVVVTSEHEHAVNTLVRWDPAGHAIRELAERRTLLLPPAVRSAALTGTVAAVQEFLELAALPDQVRVIGPAPVDPGAVEAITGEAPTSLLGESAGATGAEGSSGAGRQDEQHRALLFFGYGIAREVTARLRAVRSETSALRRFGPVHVRCDIADLL